MAKLIKVDGTIKEIKPLNGKFFTYQELKEMVEGFVEIVPLPSGKSIVVNENGKIINLPKNERATEIWKQEYPIKEYPLNNDELIVGNALIVEETEFEDYYEK